MSPQRRIHGRVISVTQPHRHAHRSDDGALGTARPTRQTSERLLALDSGSIHGFKKGSPPSSLGLQTRSKHSNRSWDSGSCWGERKEVKYEMMQFRIEADTSNSVAIKALFSMPNTYPSAELLIDPEKIYNV